MHPAVEQHRAAIVELCRRYGVRTLDVFGSATTDEFDEARSDVDFLVEFDHGKGGGGLREYFGFKEEMERLLGRPVDMLSGTIRNPYLREAIEETREPLYAA